MSLRIDRDVAAMAQPRAYAWPALVVPLEATVVALRVGAGEIRVDRSGFAIVPARSTHELDAMASGTTRVVTLLIHDAVRAAAVRDYAPHVDPRQLTEIVSSARLLPRTRWVDELVQRYLFEREVCGKRTSKAARFLEAELIKEVFFLGCEQLAGRTRASVLFEGDDLVTRARVWIEAHLFEPFRIDELVHDCHASESTVLRAFRRELGMPPRAYVRRRRLEEGLQLLASGRYAVTEVAARIGYDNPSAFAAAFRDEFHMSPSSARPVAPAAARLPAHGMPPRPARRRH